MKDLVCSEVISQFRAHTSPISALCFDPSGTLLVTASVHGNNMNIFRIMPIHKCGGSGSGDWSSSFVHLYKLYRGMTSAVSTLSSLSFYNSLFSLVTYVLTLLPLFFPLYFIRSSRISALVITVNGLLLYQQEELVISLFCLPLEEMKVFKLYINLD